MRNELSDICGNPENIYKRKPVANKFNYEKLMDNTLLIFAQDPWKSFGWKKTVSPFSIGKSTGLILSKPLISI